MSPAAVNSTRRRSRRPPTLTPVDRNTIGGHDSGTGLVQQMSLRPCIGIAIYRLALPCAPIVSRTHGPHGHP